MDAYMFQTLHAGTTTTPSKEAHSKRETAAKLCSLRRPLSLLMALSPLPDDAEGQALLEISSQG